MFNNVYELQPVFNNQLSFYGKALVICNSDGGVALKSYDTIVAFLDDDGYLTIVDTFSSTTLKHIKDFMHQNGFTVYNKSEIEDDFVIPEKAINSEGNTKDAEIL